MISSRNQRVQQLERLIDSNPPTSRPTALPSEYPKYANAKNAEGHAIADVEDNSNLRARHLSDFSASIFS